MPWIAKFNETGTHAKGVFKRHPTEEEWNDPLKLLAVPRNHYLKIRIDLYSAKGTKTYPQQYVDETAWDKGREHLVHTGKKKLNPCLCHFITIAPDTTRAEIVAYVLGIFDTTTLASLDIALASSNTPAVSHIMKLKAGVGIPQTQYLDHLLGEFLTSDDAVILSDVKQGRAPKQDAQEVIQRAENRLTVARQPEVYETINKRFRGLVVELPDISYAQIQDERMPATNIWRIAVVINFPKDVSPTSPPYPGQKTEIKSRIPFESCFNVDGIFLTITPWSNTKISNLPYRPSGIQDEIAALVFYATGEYEDALIKVKSLIEPFLDSLSFQLQTAIHAYELQVLDLTPPISVGMERDLITSKYTSGKFIPAFPSSNVQTIVYPKLDLDINKVTARKRAALRWYIKGLAANYEVDKFVFFWTALEILRSQSGVSVVSTYVAPCRHEIPYCPICGQATSKEVLGKSIKKFLVENGSISQETANKLWQFRQIVHGTKDLTYEDLQDLPIITNSLRQALITLLKSVLDWPHDQPPLLYPNGSGLITSNVINSRYKLDTHDIELAIQGSGFYKNASSS